MKQRRLELTVGDLEPRWTAVEVEVDPTIITSKNTSRLIHKLRNIIAQKGKKKNFLKIIICK